MRKSSFAVVLAAIAGLVLLVAATSGAAGTGKKLFTDLSGAEEADAQGNVGVGDPDGSGTASLRLNQGRGKVCWTITWRNIEAPTAAHIHEAPAGVPGPIVVPLEPVSSGCTSASKALIKDIRKDQSDYYVNVHNEPFPGGAIRGQLGD
jgi:hypothetical protein